MDEFISQLLACEERHELTSPEISAIATNPEQTYSNEATPSSTDGTDTDIAILVDKYGQLEPGKVITLDIATGCELLHKTRRRSDTFKKLQKKLKEDYDVELIIKSRKH